MWQVALGLLAVAIALAYYHLTRRFSYWHDQGVSFIKPYPVFGSLWPVICTAKSWTDYITQIYNHHNDKPFVGFFQGSAPALMIRDPDLIKTILVKDFAHFTDHGFALDEETEPLQSRSLFNMQGQKWKEMRAKLSPTFTSGRMKSMFPLLLECSQELERYLNKLADTGDDFDIKDMMARYTTDVIATSAFGIKCDSINNPKDHFREMGRKIFQFGFWQTIKQLFVLFLPKMARILKFSMFSKEVTEFFRSLVRDVILHRSQTGETRKDFMQLLIELKDKGRLSVVEQEDEDLMENKDIDGTFNTEYKITEDDITAQAMIFFTAGFDTSSLALTYAFYELARNPDLQKQARLHIEYVLKRHKGEVTYQALQEMTLLDSILQETLRKYPPFPLLLRMCTKNYAIPNTGVTLEKGIFVVVPIHAIQNDPKHFPDPERFDPRRFNNETELGVANFSYLPFGEGPRQCIGLRYARMQSKLGLMSVLRNFEVKPSLKTKYPITWDPKQFLLVSKHDIFVKLVQA